MNAGAMLGSVLKRDNLSVHIFTHFEHESSLLLVHGQAKIAPSSTQVFRDQFGEGSFHTVDRDHA